MAAAKSTSVVVPTRDRPGELGRCLAALAAQDLIGLEIIVVDDGSADRGSVSDAVAAVPRARLVRSPGGGPAAARNLGVRAAAGEIVCLTDDDCEPEPRWARLLATAVEAAPGKVAAGRTMAPSSAPPAVLASQAITNHLILSSLRDDGSLGFAPTCNMAARGEVLGRLPFDTAYPAAAGEDRDWWARAVAAGVIARYQPEAVVVHRPALDAGGFVRQQFRYGRGAVRYRRGTGGQRGYGRPGFYAGLVRVGFAQGPAVGAWVLAGEVATLAGAVGAFLSHTDRKAPIRLS